MTEEKKRAYWASQQIIVSHGSMSDKPACSIKKCKRKDKYLVFVGNGTKLSDLFACSCPKHLPLIIDKAVISRKKLVEGEIVKAEKRELEEAKELISSKQ